ncbi:hypothetical protein ABPG72_016810 [Tetrahymena utriculariae]
MCLFFYSVFDSFSGFQQSAFLKKVIIILERVIQKSFEDQLVLIQRFFFCICLNESIRTVKQNDLQQCLEILFIYLKCQIGNISCSSFVRTIQSNINLGWANILQRYYQNPLTKISQCFVFWFKIICCCCIFVFSYFSAKIFYIPSQFTEVAYFLLQIYCLTFPLLNTITIYACI